MRMAITGMAAALVVAAGCAGIASADLFGEWDQDRDLYIGEREWDEGLTGDGAFDAWDKDDDGMLSPKEFNRSLFRGYDLDRDRRLSQREFKAFVQDRGGDGFFDI